MILLLRLPTLMAATAAVLFLLTILEGLPDVITTVIAAASTASASASELDKQDDVVKIAYCAVQICSDVPWYYPLFTHTFRSATVSSLRANENKNIEIDFYMLRVLPDKTISKNKNATATNLLEEQRKTMCGNVGENWEASDNGEVSDQNLTSIDGIEKVHKNDIQKSEFRRQNVFYKEVTDEWFRAALEERVAGSGACGDHNDGRDSSSEDDDGDGDDDDDDLFSENKSKPLRNQAYWVYRLFGPQLFREEWFDEVTIDDDADRKYNDDDDDDDDIIVSMMSGRGNKYYKPKYTHWGYLDYDMVFSNNFPDRIYDLYKDSKRRFVGNLPPDVMSFPDQQGAQLFLAGQNTVYAMTRPPEPEQPQEEEEKNTSNSNNDRTNSNNDEKINTTKQENPNSSGSILRKIYHPLAPTRPKLRKSRRKQQRPNTKSSSSSTIRELYRPFRLSKCSSLFDSDTDSLDEVQASLSAIAGLGESPRLAFDFGAQREAYDISHGRWNLKLMLSRTRDGKKKKGGGGRKIKDESTKIIFERTEKAEDSTLSPPRNFTFDMLRKIDINREQHFWKDVAIQMMKAHSTSSTYCHEVKIRNEVSNDEYVRKELNRLYCHYPIELGAATWFGSRYVVGPLADDKRNNNNADGEDLFDAKKELDLIVTRELIPPPTTKDDGNDYDKALKRTEDWPSFFHWHRNLKSWMPREYCSPQFEAVLYRLNGYINDDYNFRLTGRNEAVNITIGWYDDIYNNSQKCPMLSMREVVEGETYQNNQKKRKRPKRQFGETSNDDNDDDGDDGDDDNYYDKDEL